MPRGALWFPFPELGILRSVHLEFDYGHIRGCGNSFFSEVKKLHKKYLLLAVLAFLLTSLTRIISYSFFTYTSNI
jgi:hypothetical protein